MAIQNLIWELESGDGKIVNMTDMWTVSGEDGSFLVRPSTQSQNPLTLTLWYKRRPYNISIRQRADGRCALGTEKANEQVCGSVLFTSLHKSLALHLRNLRVCYCDCLAGQFGSHLYPFLYVMRASQMIFLKEKKS